MRFDASMMEMEAESEGGLARLIGELPQWAQFAISILAVVVIAAVAGMIVGRLYAMVKYPDPEKHSAVSPKIKVAFICLLALCCWWLFSTMMEQSKPEEPPASEAGPGMTQGGGQYGIMQDDIAVAAPAVTVAIG